MNDNGTLWLPEPASTFTEEIDWLFYFVYWVSVVIFIAVIVTMSYFAWKYRRRSSDDRPQPVHESKILEATWIVVPTILVLVVFTWGFRSYLRMGIAPPGAYEIQVRAQKWAWQFQYPNGAVSNELHVPAGRPIRLKMSSVDVLHSIFLPNFRVKQDVLPNRYSSVWFESTKQDTFPIYCTEYCGTLHSGMLAQIIVQPQDVFNDWVTSAGVPADASPAEQGALLYTQQACNGCHSVDGTRLVGPTFQGLFGRDESLADGGSVTVDENYLRESILEPNAKVVAGFQPVMPPYSHLSEDQVTALIAFIQEQQ